MTRRWTRKREARTGRSIGYAAGIAFMVGATALLMTLMPSARRYLRMRAM